MSRHRNVRNLDFSDDYTNDYPYGRSLEDDAAVSPNTAAEFLYQRDSREAPSLSSFFETQRSSTAPSDIQSQTSTTTPPSTKPTPQAQRSMSSPSPLGQRQPQGATPLVISTPVRKKPSQTSPLVTSSASRGAVSSRKAVDETEGRVARKGPPPGFPAKAGTIVKITAEETERVSIGPAAPNPVRVSASALPKMGFFTHSLSVDEDRSRSGSSSPARTPSPDHTPHSTPTPSRHPLPQRSLSKSKHQQIDVITEYRKREQTSKAQINLVVIGHVDAGKSTLMGHLLYLLGCVSKKAMHRYEVDSQKAGKGSFAYAWVLDETGEERHRGITMDIAQQQFETENRLVTLLDAPGHRDFIPNMITGAAQADVAILVVDAAVGEFESGFEAGGQTREHALLVRSLGVRQLAVAVNKLDTVEWSQSRFNDIVQKLKTFLKQAGFRDSDVSYVPCSGLHGENLIKPSTVGELIDWYRGQTLLDRIDQFTPPPRPVDKPFRCCIADLFKATGSGFSVSARIESGHTQVGDNVLVLPANEVAAIRGLAVSEDQGSWAVAGDQVILTVTGVDMAKVSVGNVLCSLELPVSVTTRVEARIIVFNIEVPITVGYPVLLHYQSLNEPATVKKLISLLNKTSGELIRRKPRCLVKQSTAVVELEVCRPVCMELYQDCKELGRFMLRSGGSTIAAGVVTKIF